MREVVPFWNRKQPCHSFRRRGWPILAVEAAMDASGRQKIEERIREIDQWLQTLEGCEMTEGWSSYGSDIGEIAEMREERERLLRELEEEQAA